jgi:NAD/NADP transhydrogenase alpha subunit
MELLIKDKKIEINLQDEIIDAMLVIEKGEKRIKE